MSEVLRNAGVILFNGYRAENLSKLAESGKKPDLVVIGNVIRSDNPEARFAIDQGYDYSSLPEAMERLMLQDTRNLVVAGTHGKTTTSSMLAHVLVQCGVDPGYFIGGVSQDLPFSFNVTAIDGKRPFVLEGDEYDTAFWDKVPKFNHYLPDDVILTSVEFDHADIYADLAAVVRAFEGLMSRIRPQGRLIACMDYAPIKDLIKQAKVPVITYGSPGRAGARFTPGELSSEGESMRFDVLEQGKKVETLSLQVPGMHNALNALAVWIECRELGIASPQIAATLKSFRGVKRRQEVRGEKRGVMVMDDFAHHPTAVRETLRALKMKYPQRRLVTVFEPRSATSRRKIFQKDYVRAFQGPWEVLIAKPFNSTSIPEEDRFSSEELVEDLCKTGTAARLMGGVDAIVSTIKSEARSGDVVVVMSNGGFDNIYEKLLKTLG
jgi:UDP-N-acetylmuramate: L-alanyl-gamma-D-glutamyl-meso-diaminopimelate ligase